MKVFDGKLYSDILFTRKLTVHEVTNRGHLFHITKLIVDKDKHVITRLITDKGTEYMAGIDFEYLNGKDL